MGSRPPRAAMSPLPKLQVLRHGLLLLAYLMLPGDGAAAADHEPRGGADSGGACATRVRGGVGPAVRPGVVHGHGSDDHDACDDHDHDHNVG